MPPARPTARWTRMFRRLAIQNTLFNQPLATNDCYDAFLAKADLIDDSQRIWNILFELIPEQWTQNVVRMHGANTLFSPPEAPATLYAAYDVQEAELLLSLGLANLDQLAEGSWYKLQLRRQATTSLLEAGGITGEMFDPTVPAA